LFWTVKFEDIKGIFRNSNSKVRQCNGQKKNKTMCKPNPTDTSGAAKWYDYKKDAVIKHQW
jgi:hypothetical protein